MRLEHIEGEEGIFEIKRVKVYCEVIPLECGYIVKDVKNRKYKLIERKSKKMSKEKETINRIEVGDRATFGNGNIMIATTNMKSEIWREYGDVVKIERIGSSGWYTVYEKEEKKELLTEDEREFLKLYLNLLKSVVHITQLEKTNYETVKLCSINKTDENEYIYSFDISSNMLEKLNENKRYTLSELGLE